jgi:hypothetical protein
MEICIWVQDCPDSGDRLNDLAKWTKGDVIEVLPDGSFWGTEPIKIAMWRIIRVPNMPTDMALSLKAVEIPTTQQKQILRKTHLYVDLDALDALEGGIHQKSKKVKHYLDPVDSSSDYNNFKQCVKLKVPLIDSN